LRAEIVLERVVIIEPPGGHIQSSLAHDFWVIFVTQAIRAGLVGVKTR
jgi:hypothetical protein